MAGNDTAARRRHRERRVKNEKPTAVRGGAPPNGRFNHAKRDSYDHLHLNQRKASPNVTTAYASKMPMRQLTSRRLRPSSITSRRASLICVRGNAWIAGWAS